MLTSLELTRLITLIWLRFNYLLGLTTLGVSSLKDVDENLARTKHLRLPLRLLIL